MNEVEVFKLLDKITVDNFLNRQNYAVIAHCEEDNEHYLLANPRLYQLVKVDDTHYRFKDKIQQVIITVKDKHELLSAQVNHALADSLNPFKVLLLYKEGRLSRINDRLLRVLDKNKDIPDELLRELDKQLEEIEAQKQNKRIVIDISILDAVKRAHELLTKHKELLKDMTIKDILYDLHDENDERYEYPCPTEVIAYIEKTLEREERLQKKTKLERKRRIKTEAEAEQKLEEPITQTVSTPSTAPTTPIQPPTTPIEPTPAPIPTPIPTPASVSTDVKRLLNTNTEHTTLFAITTSTQLSREVIEAIIRAIIRTAFAYNYRCKVSVITDTEVRR